MPLIAIASQKAKHAWKVLTAIGDADGLTDFPVQLLPGPQIWKLDRMGCWLIELQRVPPVGTGLAACSSA
jgi:hypothetical protein